MSRKPLPEETLFARKRPVDELINDYK